MATIVIRDLPENSDLDREAMQAITGGARLRGAVTARRLSPADRLAAQAERGRASRAQAPRRAAPSVLFR